MSSLQMEGELEHFHKQNTQLELNIAELRLKLRTTDREMHKEIQKVSILRAKKVFIDSHQGLQMMEIQQLLPENYS